MQVQPPLFFKDHFLSKVENQVITLPKGGGALHGIGEKFSPDLHTGTGNFTVPIALPPGRNGFQPQLNLVYSTGSGNGPFGLGWSLSIPGVSRKTSKGVPRYTDEDIFILSGAEDLVPVPGGPPAATRYRPRTEGLFARIDHHHDSANDYWEVRSKDGLVSLYGTPRPTGSSQDWKDPAVITDPENSKHIFAWKLTRTSDPFGNLIEYLYERDLNPTEGVHHWDQLYLSEIRYVDYGTPATPQFLVTVKFSYEDRPDHFSEYRAGFEMRTVRRCARIEVSTHAGVDTLTRTYHLVYLGPNSAQLPLNGVSLPSQIKVEGHNSAQSEFLPPLEFAYTRFEPEKRDFFPITGADLPPSSLAHPEFELVGLFGNGLPDILEMNGTVRYWRNRGSGRFDLPREMKTAPAGFHLADKGVQLIDANGDGRMDLLITTESLAGYFPLQFGGLWDRRSFRPYQFAPSFDLEDPEVRLVDLDGDGVTDAIRSGTRLECFFNDPEKGWHQTLRVERRGLKEFPNINFSDPRVRWADMTGDLLQDILLVYDGNVEYWPNLGRGQWGKRIHMENSPRFPEGYDPRRILVGDVDGDGLADIVYVDHCKVLLWINQSGNHWSEPIIIHGTPPVSDIDAVRLADLLGTGISGVLWSKDAGGLSRETMFFLDFTGGLKPYLLDEMDNHMGAITRVGYAPSTRFYLDDERRPGTRWKTPLPFPVQVVARVEVIDAISGGKLTTEYSYHHGYWDGAEREFRGFGRVDQRDTEVSTDFHAAGLHAPDRTFKAVPPRAFSPPTETRTWFHQGPVGDESGGWQETDFSHEFWPGDSQALSRPPAMIDFLKNLPRPVRRDALRTLRGRILRTELYALDPTEHQDRPYTVTEYLHGVASLPVGEPWPSQPEAWQEKIFFPHTLAERVTQWERGDDPMTRFTFTDDYDPSGQPRQQTAISLPRRSVKRKKVEGAIVGQIDVNETQILATHTRTEFATPDPGLYLQDRVAQVRSLELDPPPGVVESDPNDLHQVLQDQAAAAREVHQRFRGLLDPWQTGQPLPAGVRLISHTLNHYDGTAFTGRPSGEVGPHGTLTRSESLAFTDAELDAAYGNRRPTYLGGSAVPPPGAPAGFGSNLGYRPESASPTGYHAGYYVDTQRQQFDFQDSNSAQQRGLVVATQDALGHQSEIKPDTFWLLPERVIDPVNLVTSAQFDYRVMQPSQVTDPNENVTHFRFTPLGLLQKQFLEGHGGEGGTKDKPEVEFSYDFLAYERTRLQPNPQPVSVHTRQRVWHVSDNKTDETIESREYSDGFGRLVQKRAQAEELVFGATGDDVGLLPEPGGVRGPAVGQRAMNRVVVSGWQVYDNKGRVIEKYEPFFAAGWDYQPESEAKRGEHASLYYDPRGQLIRTVNPDGSEQQVIFGIPLDLAHPQIFSPTPWESYTYDPNDLAPLSFDPVETLPDGSPKPLTERAPADHHFTPANTVLDALGRIICQVERNGSVSGEWHITRSRYDVRGNLLSVIDAMGRLAFQHAYDLLNRLLRVDSIDAGLRTSVLDAIGNLAEYRDSKDSIALRQYDDLNRLTHLWARDDADHLVTLRELLEYGDAGDRDANRAKNRLGKLFRHSDEAGHLQFDLYDFKGNVIDKTRQVISDTALRDGWIVDWSAPDSDSHLDITAYQTHISYDALNRPVQILTPRDVNGLRAEIKPHYNRAGALEKVKLDDTLYVAQIAYNAKGQRVLIAYGNSVMTRYQYDPHTFRLTRLRTERCQDPSPPNDTWTGAGGLLQEFTYTYDLVGNIGSIEDRTPGSGITNSLHGRDRLVRQFLYDPLYRLTQADGRACQDIGAPRPADDSERCGAYRPPYTGGPPVPNQDNAPDLTEHYTEMYSYDPAGNMLRLAYAAASGNWTRQFGLGNLPPDQWQNAPDNRLTQMKQNGETHNFEYDPSGNLHNQNTDRHHGWDHADRMISFTIQPAGSPQASVEARYLYGADGLRVKKWTRNNGESTVYIDGIFEHYTNNVTGLANNHLHVMDGKQRIAILLRGPRHPDDAGPPIQYHLGDHLGSSHVVVDEHGSWVNREEYFPYGETSFGSFARKRYRFTGKERDEKSGLYYHGARYYAPWMARWVSCDPKPSMMSNLYIGLYNNPILYTDPNGAEPQIAVGASVYVRGTLGNQNKSTSVGINAFGAVSTNYGSLEAGLTLSTAHNYQKFTIEPLGEGSNARSFSFSWRAQAALGGHRGFLGLDSGSPTPLFNNDRGNWAVGIGIGQRYNALPTRLSDFENTQGTVSGYFAKSDWKFNLLGINDAYIPRLGFFGGGTDLGPTFSGRLGIDVKNQSSVLTFGIGEDMFTPIPVKPASSSNVRGGRFGTYSTTGTFPDLYYNNVFAFAGYRSPNFQLSLESGIEYQRLGATFQDFIHNNLTSSPFFGGWDLSKPPSGYIEASGTATKSLSTGN